MGMHEGATEVFQALAVAPQERLESFLSLFTELCPAECALLALREQQQQQSSSKAATDMAGASFTAEDGDFAENVWRRFRERQDHNDANGTNSHISEAMEGELEVVELDESTACRTSSMTAFLEHGMTDVVPTVGVFVEGLQEELEKNREGKEMEGDPAEPAEESGTNILQEVNGEGSVGYGGVAFEGGPSSDSASDAVSVESQESSRSDISFGDINLPGISASGESKGEVPTPCPHVFLKADEVKGLEVDEDYVQPFALDPYFDYEATIVGKSVRLHPREFV
ncbi:hypothetical protein, conserved [Trypanosoma brucei brucei TREU927]|uniref:Uncharacterized protein n=1 Tax=Trypanosoma brucei brucei (strain 927/4 GUTat10.1) TaxID=185431 RepID=Q38A90_TRYB2|nr:hypothetical protein, conserved [Trypanosoma brucei brucei TREU927]EAN78280.1 hypothetical protein, conserved [Trypanosoma brucei brucei TREU927]